MLGDMMKQLQQQVEEAKKRLDTITVDAEAGNGAVKITCTGNREIKTIDISQDLLSSDKEELEDLLIVAMNRVLEKANNVHESEMQGTAKGMLPGMPDLF